MSLLTAKLCHGQLFISVCAHKRNNDDDYKYFVSPNFINKIKRNFVVVNTSKQTIVYLIFYTIWWIQCIKYQSVRKTMIDLNVASITEFRTN